jgi:hypothetical protein
VQSSAYLHVLMFTRLGTVFSKYPKSLICTLNKVGDITELCGTPKGCIDDIIPCKWTCCVLPVKKHLISIAKTVSWHSYRG